jgi:hypothetical protein
MKNQSRAGNGWPALSISTASAAGLLLLLLLGYYHLRKLGESLILAPKHELRNVLTRWKQANMTQTNLSLGEFMKGTPKHLVVSNQSFNLGGSNYISVFATTQVPMGGTMFITDEGITIWRKQNGIIKVLP